MAQRAGPESAASVSLPVGKWCNKATRKKENMYLSQQRSKPSFYIAMIHKMIGQYSTCKGALPYHERKFPDIT